MGVDCVLAVTKHSDSSTPARVCNCVCVWRMKGRRGGWGGSLSLCSLFRVWEFRGNSENAVFRWFASSHMKKMPDGEGSDASWWRH